MDDLEKDPKALAAAPPQNELYAILVTLWEADNLLKAKGHSLAGLLNHASKGFFGVDLNGG